MEQGRERKERRYKKCVEGRGKQNEGGNSKGGRRKTNGITTSKTKKTIKQQQQQQITYTLQEKSAQI